MSMSDVHAQAMCPQRAETGLESSELNVQTVASYHMGAGDWTWVLLTTEPSSEELSNIVKIDKK